MPWYIWHYVFLHLDTYKVRVIFHRHHRYVIRGRLAEVALLCPNLKELSIVQVSRFQNFVITLYMDSDAV